MRAINHALTGAIIGIAVPIPIIALPLALASHFICDAIPHYGDERTPLKSKLFAYGLLVDALLCIALVCVLFSTNQPSWFIASLCAFIATSPDFFWVPKYLRARKDKKFSDKPNWFMRWAKDIQWFEKPIGAVVEFAWLIAGSTVLFALLSA